MDKQLDKRFERVERALATLVDSITKYTPSTAQAHDLAAADKELSDGLVELQTHQNNQLRIHELRRETADLDAQIKSTVSLLWGTRKEITATPTTSYPSAGPRYDFTYADLLSYARRISHTTLPPPGVTNGVDLSAAGAPSSDQPPAPSADQTPATANGGASSSSSPPPPTNNPFSTALPEHLLPAVRPLPPDAVFCPWPGEERVRAGALALCQRLADAGIDPRGHDPEREERERRAAAEEARRRDEEEEVARRRREEERFARMARERAAAAAAAATAAEREREREGGQEVGGAGAGAGSSPVAAGRAEKKQFQFMDGLDDDEDEE